MNKHLGFTIIELSIALVIIALILGMVVVKGGSLIGDTKTTSTITLIKDLTGATVDFKSRYHYLPGDLPKAGDDIAGIASGSACDSGNGDGLIDDATNEIPCVATHLVLAGLIKGSASGIMSPYNSGLTPDVIIRSAKSSQVNKAGTNSFTTVQNLIEINSIPCEAAIAIDNKIDDGVTTTGNVRIEPACSAPTVVGKVTTLDIAI
jgi:prepilin-type N-terminal cleavage/methylation domain-containing protein